MPSKAAGIRGHTCARGVPNQDISTNTAALVKRIVVRVPATPDETASVTTLAAAVATVTTAVAAALITYRPPRTLAFWRTQHSSIKGFWKLWVRRHFFCCSLRGRPWRWRRRRSGGGGPRSSRARATVRARWGLAVEGIFDGCIV